MNEMNFEDFKQWAENNVKFFLPESDKDAKIDIYDVVKTGASYTGMTVRNEGQKVAPAVNLDTAFAAYQNGSQLYEIGVNMAEIIQAKQPELDTGIFNSYEKLKNNLFIRVCNTEENAEMLKNVPHTDVADLSVTYHVMVENNHDSIASATITNAMLKTIIDVIEVDDDANIEVRLKLLNEIGTNQPVITKFEDIIL